MKKSTAVLFVLACLCLFACSPTETPTVTGVTFEDLSVDQAVAKAAEENKLVLIDVFSPT
ncbi:hypothetical protein ACFLT9_02515 [Acidobacteriota bacterium]